MAQLTNSFFQKILKIEGGYQNLPTDSGNYCGGALIGTNMGMSAVAVGEWWGRCPTVAEMKAMDQKTAFDFYAWYFNRYRLFGIENQQFAELLMNNTMGNPSQAAKIEQRVLNEFGYTVAVDGVRGSQTVAALNAAYAQHGARLHNTIRERWIEFLLSINKPEFHAGWLKRMESFPPMSVGVGGITLVGIGLLIYLIIKK